MFILSGAKNKKDIPQLEGFLAGDPLNSWVWVVLSPSQGHAGQRFLHGTRCPTLCVYQKLVKPYGEGGQGPAVSWGMLALFGIHCVEELWKGMAVPWMTMKSEDQTGGGFPFHEYFR